MLFVSHFSSLVLKPIDTQWCWCHQQQTQTLPFFCKSHRKEKQDTEQFQALAAQMTFDASQGANNPGDKLRTPKQMKADCVITPVVQSCYLSC